MGTRVAAVMADQSIKIFSLRAKSLNISMTMQRADNSINTIASTLKPFHLNLLRINRNNAKRIQKERLTGSPMPQNQVTGSESMSKIISIARVVIASEIPSIAGRFNRKVKEVINIHRPVIEVTAYNDQLIPFTITISTIMQIRLAEKAMIADSSHAYILYFFPERRRISLGYNSAFSFVSSFGLDLHKGHISSPSSSMTPQLGQILFFIPDIF